MLIHIFERPKWTYKPHTVHDWQDTTVYPSFGMSYMDPVTTNVLTLLVLAVATGHRLPSGPVYNVFAVA